VRPPSTLSPPSSARPRRALLLRGNPFARDRGASSLYPPSFYEPKLLREDSPRDRTPTSRRSLVEIIPSFLRWKESRRGVRSRCEELKALDHTPPFSFHLLVRPPPSTIVYATRIDMSWLRVLLLTCCFEPLRGPLEATDIDVRWKRNTESVSDPFVRHFPPY